VQYLTNVYPYLSPCSSMNDRGQHSHGGDLLVGNAQGS
jgi:hypothetical protein